MNFLAPEPPPYDPLEVAALPLPDRSRRVCEGWVVQGYGAPISVYLFYALKVALYIGMWSFFCGFTPGLGGLARLPEWWLSPVAFQKAILWSGLFEILGLGCGSGPLTARYVPPVAAFVHFCWPGTTKLPFFAGAPLIGGSRRTWLDVAGYLALLALLVRALVSAQPGFNELAPIVILVPILGLLDRTLFLAFRGEHYWTTLVCFVVGGNWIAGAKCVQLALWFWAGISKLNPHFPFVLCVMISNHPVMRSRWVRKRMYRHFPDDLRPSTLAHLMAAAGTALELSVPLVLLLPGGHLTLVLGMLLMFTLHVFITSNVPMGVPIEWNFMVVYGACALFWAHPDISPFALGSAQLAVFLAVMVVGVPLLGELFPGRLSFLVAMRYYAGNWPFGVWLFRGGAHKKLDKLRKCSGWVPDQLARFYDHPTTVGLNAKVLAFRLMHLHGRALAELIPRAVSRFADYEYCEGEIIAGLALGWNFGDGRLHDEHLLPSIQQQCGFESGELRCLLIGSQPMGGSKLDYRIWDARDGLVESGALDVQVLKQRQPWIAEPSAVVQPGADLPAPARVG